MSLSPGVGGRAAAVCVVTWRVVASPRVKEVAALRYPRPARAMPQNQSPKNLSHI